jgi:hypothetical protein
MKKLLDPIANVKTIAFLFILLGLGGAVAYFPKLSSLSSNNELITIVSGSVFSLAYIIVGFGLRKIKLWALYGFMVLTGLELLNTIINFQFERNKIFSIIINLIYIGLVFWFYSAKDRFKK